MSTCMVERGNTGFTDPSAPGGAAETDSADARAPVPVAEAGGGAAGATTLPVGRLGGFGAGSEVVG